MKSNAVVYYLSMSLYLPLLQSFSQQIPPSRSLTALKRLASIASLFRMNSRVLNTVAPPCKKRFFIQVVWKELGRVEGTL